MTLAKVRDKKTGLERTVTPKAYSIIPHRYTLLGYVDKNGNEVGAPSNVDSPVVTKSEKKKVVAPAEDKSGIPTVTREDLDRMNQEAIEKAKAKAEAEKAKEFDPEVLLVEVPVEKPAAVKAKGRPKSKVKTK